VIDPKGVMGEPIYEVGAFIRNPIPEIFAIKDKIEIIKKRIQIITEQLKFDSKRILEWCFVQSVLAWIWTIEDTGDDEQDKEHISYWQKMTEIFEQMLLE
jgi:streptomycin 6-kinase